MKKAKKIIVSIIIFIAVLLISNSSYAMTQEDAGQALADFSIYFYKHYGAKTLYSVEGRETTYTGRTVDGYYKFDCVGWVDFAVHQSLKLGGPTMSYFAVPPGGGNTPYYRNGFECIKGDYTNANNLLSREEVESTVQPGDILFCGPTGPHVVIYVGDHNIIHCYSNLECEDLYDNDMHYTGYCAIGRITQSAAAGIDEDNVVTEFEGEGYDEEGLEYKGTTEGHYKGKKQTSSWLFENFVGFLDYLFGMLAYIIRAPFVGWANIIENTINDTISDVSKVNIQETTPDDEENTDETVPEDEEKSSEKKNLGLYKPTATLKYGDEHRINVEDVIYNKIPLLDVDFFDVDLSESKSNSKVTISDDSVIYKLRENVSLWYYVIRLFSIAALLLVLIYLGIRLAISTTSGDKAKYKSMLTAWVTSFIIVFFIHYFMIAVIETNDYLVNLFKATEVKYTGGLSMYDTIRTRAYSLKLSEGLSATVMYMVLIYYLIRFLFVYLKRYLTVNILALLGPVTAVKYAIDKINKGKSNSMVSWMRDFALNVLLQSVHALLYTSLMIIAYEIGMESIPGFILALIILNFVFKAEDIFIDIFKFDGSSLGGVRENKNYFAEAFAVTTGIGYMTSGIVRFGFGAVKNTTKFAGDLGIFAAQIATGGTRKIVNEDGEVEYSQVDVRGKLEEAKGNAMTLADDGLYKVTGGINRFGHTLVNKILRRQDDGTKTITGVRSLRLGLYKMKQRDPKLYKTTKELLDKTSKLNRQVFTRSISSGFKSIKTMTYLAASVPMMVVSPKSGFTMFSSALQDIMNTAEGSTYYGHMTKKQIRGRRGRVAAVLLTGGTGYAVVSAIDIVKQNEKDSKKIEKNNIMLADLKRANILERDIEKEIEKINEELEKDKESLDTEEERKILENEVNNRKKDAIQQALDSALKSKNLKTLINDYMNKNNLTRLSESDVDNLLRELNLDTINSEIKSLSNLENVSVQGLNKKLDDLKKQLKDQISSANSEMAREKIEKKIKETEDRIKQKELVDKVGIETIKSIKDEIENSRELSEGMFMEKNNIEKVIVEYMDKNNVQTINKNDAGKVATYFNEKARKGQIDTYANKSELTDQFKKQNEDGKGLNKKKTVNAILDANEKQGGKNINVDEKYKELSNKIRELEILNQKFINNNGKKAIDMAGFVKNIKK